MQLKKSSGRKRYNDGDDKIDTTEQEESKANGKDENSEYDEEVGDSGSKIDCISQRMATTMTVDDSDIPEVCPAIFIDSSFLRLYNSAI